MCIACCVKEGALSFCDDCKYQANEIAVTVLLLNNVDFLVEDVWTVLFLLTELDVCYIAGEFVNAVHEIPWKEFYGINNEEEGFTLLKLFQEMMTE